jgi:hypothetical protein
MADERRAPAQPDDRQQALRLEALRYLTQAIDEAGNELRSDWWSREDPDLASIRKDTRSPEWQLLERRKRRIDEEGPERRERALLPRVRGRVGRRERNMAVGRSMTQRRGERTARLSGVPGPPWQGRIMQWARALVAVLAVTLVVAAAVALSGLLLLGALIVAWYVLRLAGTLRRERYLSRVFSSERAPRRQRPVRKRRRDPAEVLTAADVRRARRLWRKGDLAGAERAWRHAAEAGRPGAELGLGRVLEALGDERGAESAFRREAERARERNDTARFEVAQGALRRLGVRPEPPLRDERAR